MKIQGTTINTPIARTAVVKDDIVSAKPWSSKNTVDKLCPTFAESGTIVTCEPVEGYPLEVEWETKNRAKADASRTVDVGGGLVVTATKGSAEIVVNGTATKNHSMRLFYGITLPAGTYTVWVSGLNGSDYLNSQDTADAYVFTGAGKKTFSLSEKKTMNISVVFVSGSVYDNAPVKIQIEKGSSATAYEPYAETATITRCGKNIARYPYTDTTKTVNGITFTDNGDGTITANGTATASANFNLGTQRTWALKPGADYTASINQVSGTATGIPGFVVNYYRPGASVGGYSAWLSSAVNKAVTKPCPADYASVRSYINIPSGCTCTDLVLSVQLEAGTTATNHEPYTEPETFAPGEPITAIQGVNTIYADAGLVTVKGKADPVAIIDNLKTRLAALEAAVVNNA